MRRFSAIAGAARGAALHRHVAPRAYNLAMLDAIKSLAERSVRERLVLLVNHVIAAEPAAVERLRPHAARAMQIELTAWPSLLPKVGPFVFRVTPAGMLEWYDDYREQGDR